MVVGVLHTPVCDQLQTGEGNVELSNETGDGTGRKHQPSTTCVECCVPARCSGHADVLPSLANLGDRVRRLCPFFPPPIFIPMLKHFFWHGPPHAPPAAMYLNPHGDTPRRTNDFQLRAHAMLVNHGRHVTGAAVVIGMSHDNGLTMRRTA